MTAPETALAIFVAVQIVGAVPDVPAVTGGWTWLLKWLHDAAQAVARNKDKLR